MSSTFMSNGLLLPHSFQHRIDKLHSITETHKEPPFNFNVLLFEASAKKHNRVFVSFLLFLLYLCDSFGTNKLTIRFQKCSIARINEIWINILLSFIEMDPISAGWTRLSGNFHVNKCDKFDICHSRVNIKIFELKYSLYALGSILGSRKAQIQSAFTDSFEKYLHLSCLFCLSQVSSLQIEFCWSFIELNPFFGTGVTLKTGNLICISDICLLQKNFNHALQLIAKQISWNVNSTMPGENIYQIVSTLHKFICTIIHCVHNKTRREKSNEVGWV